MKQHILTTASFYFTNSWARFMSTGYFVLGKYREMEDVPVPEWDGRPLRVIRSGC